MFIFFYSNCLDILVFHTCIEFMKCTFKKCRQNDNDVSFDLLHILLTQIGAGVSSQAMLLFNMPIRVMLLQIGREPISINKEDEYYEALISR